MCPESKIVTAGWNRRLTIYVDDVEDDTTSWLERFHQDDILTLTLCPPNLVASASYDGQICVWSMDTSRLLLSTMIPDRGEVVDVGDTAWTQSFGNRNKKSNMAEWTREDGDRPKIEQKSVEKLVFIKVE